MDFTIVGIPFDKTQTLRKGAALGPKVLRAIFPKLETYIFGIDLTKEAYFHDLGDIEANDLHELEKELKNKLNNSRGLPIILGGEHSITVATANILKPDKIVIFDAHADCEESNGHDGIVRALVRKFGAENILLYGVRVASKIEHSFIKEHGVKIVGLKDLKRLKGRVYLSIDFDVLDPSILACVGNPEPMGLSFSELSYAISLLAPKLVAVDFVEFTPFSGELMGVHALIAGKLIYATIARIIEAKVNM